MMKGVDAIPGDPQHEKGNPNQKVIQLMTSRFFPRIHSCSIVRMLESNK
jgi:hypothetical protein